MTAYIFPGQGAQKLNMGANLFKKFPRLVSIADNVLGYSIEELCTKGNERLNQTEYTQPALFVTNTMAYLEYHFETGKMPDYLAGHSLGEYNALYVAEAFDFETGVKLVKERGRLMAMMNEGAMAAIVGLPLNHIQRILTDEGRQNVQIANLNSPIQCVISGEKNAIHSLKSTFENAGAKLYSVLNVSGAFHSQYMREAASKFEKFIAQIPLSKPKASVIANINGLPYETDESSIRKNLVAQMYSPVRWSDSVLWILNQDSSKEIIEISAGKLVLTKLLDQIKSYIK